MLLDAMPHFQISICVFVLYYLVRSSLFMFIFFSAVRLQITLVTYLT